MDHIILCENIARFSAQRYKLYYYKIGHYYTVEYFQFYVKHYKYLTVHLLEWI